MPRKPSLFQQIQGKFRRAKQNKQSSAKQIQQLYVSNLSFISLPYHLTISMLQGTDLEKGVPVHEKRQLLISMMDLIARQSAAHSIISLDQTRPKVRESADNAAVACVNVMQAHRPGAPNPVNILQTQFQTCDLPNWRLVLLLTKGWLAFLPQKKPTTFPIRLVQNLPWLH